MGAWEFGSKTWKRKVKRNGPPHGGRPTHSTSHTSVWLEKHSHRVNLDAEKSPHVGPHPGVSLDRGEGVNVEAEVPGPGPAWPPSSAAHAGNDWPWTGPSETLCSALPAHFTGTNSYSGFGLLSKLGYMTVNKLFWVSEALTGHFAKH